MKRELDDHDLDWAINEALLEEARGLTQRTSHSPRANSRYRRLRRPTRKSSVLATVAIFLVASAILWFTMRDDDRRSEFDAALDELRIDPDEMREALGPDEFPVDPNLQEEPPEDPVIENGWKRQLELLLTSHDRALREGQITGKPHQRITDSPSLLWSALNKEPAHWKEVRSSIEARAFGAWEPDVRRRIAMIMVRDPSTEGSKLTEGLLLQDPGSFGHDEIILLMQGGLKSAADEAHRRLKAAPKDRDLIWLAVRAALFGDPVGLPLLQREFLDGKFDHEGADRRLGAALALRKIKDSHAFAIVLEQGRGLALNAVKDGDLDEALWIYLRLRYFGEAASGRKIDLAHMPVDIKRFARTVPEFPDAAALRTAIEELGQRKH